MVGVASNQSMLLKDALNGIINDPESEELVVKFNELLQFAPSVFHKYEVISQHIYELEESNYEQLESFFSETRDYNIFSYQKFRGKLTASNDNIELLDKFERHVKLACSQRKFILNNVSEANQIVKEMLDLKTKIYSEFIAILGIFTAISFLTMGSIQVLGDLFKGVGEPAPDKFGYALVVGGIYIVIMYVFILTMFIGMRKVIGNNTPYQFTWGFCIFVLIVSSTLISVGLFLLNTILPAVIILTTSITGLIVLLIKSLSDQISGNIK